MSGTDDIWNDLFGGFDSLNRRIEDMFSRMDMSGPDVKTYGYTMWQGPDGVRHVKEFGNTGSRLNGCSSRPVRSIFCRHRFFPCRLPASRRHGRRKSPFCCRRFSPGSLLF